MLLLPKQKIFNKNTMKNKIVVGALAVAGAALLWSLDGTFLRPQLSSLPSVLVVFLEHLLGFIALLPFFIIYRQQIKSINKKQWLTIFWVALFGGALGTTFMTKALFLTGFRDISVVILLQKFQPLFAITLAVIFLREKFPPKFYWYATLAIISGYFVTFKDPTTVSNVLNTTSLIALFSLAAAFSWGSSTTFGKYSLKNINYGLLAALRFGLTSLIMLIPTLKYFSELPTVSGRAWSTLIIIVFTSGALAMYLYYFGLKKIPASLATLCELAWPVSAIFFDYFLNKNILSISQIIGSVVLIASVYMITRMQRRRVIFGTILPGTKQGQKLDAPTANLDPKLAQNLPRGLYSCEVILDNNNYKGLLFFGENSLTKKDCLEVHILNFSNNDLYGKNITVTTDRFLRLPKKFNNPSDLFQQIQTDLKLAKEETAN